MYKSMENNSSDQEDKKYESAPKLNINFLKTLVIILGLAIFLLIFVIIYKVLNGDLKNKKQNIDYKNSNFSEFLLEIPNINSIKSIEFDNENILIVTDDNNVLSLITITKENKLKIINLKNSNKLKLNKLN